MILDKIKELHALLASYSEDHRAILGIFYPMNMARVKRGIEKGKWSVLTYAAHERQTATYGLRIIPDLPSDKWPVVSTMPYMETETEALDMKTEILQGHVDVLNKYYETCEVYLNKWEKFHSIILPVYQLFGGEDDLDDLRKIVFNREKWPAKDISEDEVIHRQRLYRLEKDPSDANKYLWDFLDKLQDTDYLPELPMIDLGIYSDMVKNIIAARAYITLSTLPISEVREHLFQAVLYTHGFDTRSFVVPYFSGVVETVLEIFNPLEDLYDELSEGEEPYKIESMPEFSIVMAMHEQKRHYNGTAHVEVAALMDEKYNDPKKAWTYLVSAGYWAGKNMPEAQPTIIKAAIHLCEKNNWNEAVEVLKYNLEILESN